MNRNSNIRLKVKDLFFLKLTAFNPQVIAPMETRLDNGTLQNISNIIDTGIGIEGKLKVELCNSIEHNISRGRVADIVNGWHSERFTFIMIVEVYDGNNVIAEEIYQGYTDHANTTGGNIAMGGVVSIDPNTEMYVTKVLTISHRRDEMGNVTPVIHPPSNIFVNMNSRDHNTGFVLNRPSDICMRHYTNELSDVTDSNMEVKSDISNYNGYAKLSKLANESSGTVVTSLVKAADKARRASKYVFSSSDNISNYEGMLDSISDDITNDYYLLRAIGDKYSRIHVSNFTVDELSKLFGGYINPYVSTLTSYNDIITKNTNQVFNFNGTSDRGDDVTSDNKINRFQKKVVPFIFDKMMSLGYIVFSGVLSNKGPGGRIFIQHSALKNMSNTINNNSKAYNEVMRLLYESLTSDEATRLISGGLIRHHDIEMVFDFSIFNSVVSIKLDGYESVIRIPSMADSLFSSVISTEPDSIMLSTELKTVVDKVLNVSDAVTNGRTENIWE